MKSRPTVKNSEDVLELQSEDESDAPIFTDLTATVGAFETRFQKKRRQQQQEETEAEVEARKRRNVLLQSLMNIRKSLSKVARINLGEQFEFDMFVDDWHGWPRMTIHLRDRECEDGDYPFFQVTANDRQANALIEIIYCSLDNRERISLANESDAMRLPAVLKKCVRIFLDQVEAVILTAKRDADEGSEELKAKSLDDMQDDTPKGEEEISGDLFVDDSEQSALFDQLPELEHIESLPGSK
ncbi:MAG: hypothetical protein KDD44_01100 [Bdellovibrionales bacterium]|nr:hypothetical protein [Bdellovibrionales bacterium]